MEGGSRTGGLACERSFLDSRALKGAYIVVYYSIVGIMLI